MKAVKDPHEIRFESDSFATDDMQMYHMSGRETISQLFEFIVDVVIPAGGSKPDMEEALLASATLVFSRNGEEERRIHGMVATIDQLYDIDPEVGSLFSLRFVPHVYTLTLAKTQDVFLDTSVPALIEDKLRNHGVEASGYNMTSLIANYPQREFIVQYQETDLAFVSRLSEHLGISFYFDHAGGWDQLVFCDNNDGFLQSDANGALQLDRHYQGDGVYEFRCSVNAIPAMYMMMEYNYRTPDVDLTSTHESAIGAVGGIVEWGSHFKDLGEGQALAKIRAEELEATKITYRAASNDCTISAGFRYTIEGHADFDGVELLVTEVTHEAHLTTQLGFGQADKSGYRNRFKAIPASQTYRPPRITPRPRISGLVHGIVEPQEMESVEPNPRIDGEGRYWIKFLFDMVPLGERKASRPVRRAQPTVGARYGMHFPLRPGIEVLMAFVNGDPDRPIVVGAVHNARTPNHVDTNNALQSVIETVSGVKMTFKDPTLRRP